MKNLLALALVLGMAGIASAGLTLVREDTGPGMANLSIQLDTGNIKAYKLGLQWDDERVVTDYAAVEFPATFDFAGKVQALGKAGELPNYGEITAGQFLSPAVEAPVTLMRNLGINWLALAPGEVATLTVVSLGGTTIDNVAIPAGEPLLSIDVVGIPEPMTFGLLGLGALFLRRRK